MQDYKETDTVQDLYNEIENLIDIPFETNTCQPIKNKDFHYKQDTEESNNDYTFDRPILIESDSDDIEELLATPDQFCYQFDKPITSNNSLTVTNNICNDCSTKKRSRSSSFTFTQLADKLKQSFGHSSSVNNLLTPAGVKSIDRRKSMPSMNSLFDQQQSLQPPSPMPSRPSSRASSFIEDVKQFLAPLSRKSSRNSIYQDFQQSEPQLEKKSSHHSLLDAINICKPTKPKQTPSYERRIIHNEDLANWSQEDEEVMDIHQNSSWQQDSYLGTAMENNIVPLRRKQIKKIESRQERIDIYNSAYLECMKVETDLVPWIIQQTQKGPPDAWFGYTPPTREPKKIMGIFKRKPKENSSSLRAQQRQLGDDLLNRSTPLLQHRYSNSNLSTSPSSFVYALDDQIATSPGEIGYEEDQEYFGDQNYTPSLTTSPNSSTEPVTRPLSSQPVSILKKIISNPQPYDDYDETAYYDEQEECQRNYYQQPAILKNERKQRLTSSRYDLQQMMEHPPTTQRSSSRNNDYRPEHDRSGEDDYYNYHRSSDTSTSLASRQNEEPTYFNDSIVLNKRRGGNRHQTYEEEEDYYQPPLVTDIRRRSKPIHQYYVEEEYYQPSPVNDARRRSKPIYQSHPEEDYYQPPLRTDVRRRSKPVNQPHEEGEYYQPPPITDIRRRSQLLHQPHEEEEYYQAAPVIDTRRRSKQTHQDYYGLSVKVTPFMMEEWEIALDDLCDLYPRLDRHYINDFLRSAQGDFVTAKDMIMKMIMDIR